VPSRRPPALPVSRTRLRRSGKYAAYHRSRTASVTRCERPTKALSRVARNEVISSQPANRETVEWWTPNDFAICRHVSPWAKRCRTSACWKSVSLGFRPNRIPRLRAAARPSLARLTIRCLSSSANAERKAIKPRPIGVVRSRWGLSSTLINAPRACIRSMIAIPSIMLRVHRSHSPSTRISPLPS
jgi:hypothetical protein